MATKEILYRRKQKTHFRPRMVVGVLGLVFWLFATVAIGEIAWERFGNEANYVELALALCVVLGGFGGCFYLLGVRRKKSVAPVRDGEKSGGA